MLRPIRKTVNVVVRYRHGLLGTVLLSTLALPQWSAAFSAHGAGDGGIVLAQANTQDDPKQTGKPKGKEAPKAVPKIIPKQQIIQQQGTTQSNGQQGQQQQQQQQQQQTGKGQQQFRKQQSQTGQGQQQQQTGQGQQQFRSQQQQTGQNQQQQSGQSQQNLQQGDPKYRKAVPKSQSGQGQQNVLPKSIQGTPKNAVRQDGPKIQFGTVDQLRTQRHERREGNRLIIEEPGNRLIVRENGRVFVRHNDAERFRRFGNVHEERHGAEVYTIVRRGGYEIVTVTDANGRLLRRFRRGPDRREVILIDNRPRAGATGFFLGLAAPAITIPRNRYIVDVEGAPPALLYETLEAPPLVPIERAYSLDEVRYNVELRDRMRRLDIDSIHFESGSWEVAPEQFPALQGIAETILRIVSRNPDEVIMIEGYTDAVGTDVDNLSLSDRRAESVADILTSSFNVPPENLVTQGYGEQFLKIPTDGPSRENRRVTVRRITPLLRGQAAAR